MKLNKRILSVLALSGVIAFTGVQAHDRFSDENRLERLAEYLDLTAEQKTNISAVMVEFKGQRTRPERSEIKANVQEMKARFNTLMIDPTFDEQAVKTQLEKRSIKKNEAILNKIKQQHAIYQLLTPEQQPLYLKNIKMMMRNKMGNMMAHARF